VILESSDSFRTSAFPITGKVNAPVHSEMELEQGGLFQVSNFPELEVILL